MLLPHLFSPSRSIHETRKKPVTVFSEQNTGTGFNQQLNLRLTCKRSRNLLDTAAKSERQLSNLACACSPPMPWLNSLVQSLWGRTLRCHDGFWACLGRGSVGKARKMPTCHNLLFNSILFWQQLQSIPGERPGWFSVYLVSILVASQSAPSSPFAMWGCWYWGVNKKHLESDIPSFKSWLNHVLIEWSWSSDSKLLSFNFSVYKMGTQIPVPMVVLRVGCDNAQSGWHKVGIEETLAVRVSAFWTVGSGYPREIVMIIAKI